MNTKQNECGNNYLKPSPNNVGDTKSNSTMCCEGLTVKLRTERYLQKTCLDKGWVLPMKFQRLHNTTNHTYYTSTSLNETWEGKKPQKRDGLKQFIVLVMYSVNISHVLCDIFIALLFVFIQCLFPHSSVEESTVHRGTRMPIVVCLLAAEDTSKGLHVQTYEKDENRFSSGLRETWQGVSYPWVAVEGLPGNLGALQEGPVRTEASLLTCSLESPGVDHHTGLWK